MAAVPSIGRAGAVEARPAAPAAELAQALYERHAHRIFTYCLHRLGSREEAEDATETTFLNAFRGLQRGVVPELESAWLFEIARNVILTRCRSSSRRRRVETPGDLDAMQDLLPSRERDADEWRRAGTVSAATAAHRTAGTADLAVTRARAAAYNPRIPEQEALRCVVVPSSSRHSRPRSSPSPPSAASSVPVARAAPSRRRGR